MHVGKHLVMLRNPGTLSEAAAGKPIKEKPIGKGRATVGKSWKCKNGKHADCAKAKCICKCHRLKI